MTTSNANEKPREQTSTGPTHPETVQTELYFPSILGYEKIARGAAAALAEHIELPPDRVEDLKTAVAEACLNAIEHGNSLDRALKVTVEMIVTGRKLEVRVADVGRQVIPETLPTPGTGESMRGWGMFFIKNLVDEMELRRLPEGGNEVRMAIDLGPARAAETSSESNESAPVASYENPGAVATVRAKPSAPTETETYNKPEPAGHRSNEQSPVSSADETVESNDDAPPPSES